jgi:hypothetical protein
MALLPKKQLNQAGSPHPLYRVYPIAVSYKFYLHSAGSLEPAVKS